ncbi:peptide deformylase [Candidatus Falkowbacteria bacterium CG10_big_fil_rev_8_21_14_0_10_39_9]|uniref:Peptide deformylase n=1 Tax=Candidatus Falkowbacteria bacterium CG10_big_fil_rev_8_21_14_0_10_39_9 TaxID=1974566 RepID=A0A2M6WPD2_9BACT|nr:MAG: peptide deformylase [Candidatus Falkowbacteria bacterium CG10_big_fil_rev_8_21_14_0_10_39_9]
MSKLLPILNHPNPILRKISRPLTLEEIRSPKIQSLISDIEKTMITKDGAGLAAPQIGENIRLLVLRDGERVMVIINPQITKKSWAREVDEEGCLSVLDKAGNIIFGNVERHKKIQCSYLDTKGKKQKISAENILARIIQHETDHLNGILFIDKLYHGK